MSRRKRAKHALLVPVRISPFSTKLLNMVFIKRPHQHSLITLTRSLDRNLGGKGKERKSRERRESKKNFIFLPNLSTFEEIWLLLTKIEDFRPLPFQIPPFPKLISIQKEIISLQMIPLPFLPNLSIQTNCGRHNFQN